MITRKAIVTNNMRSVKRYEGKDVDIIFVGNAGPQKVFERTMKLLEEGGRLSNPKIKDPLRYYRTIGVFFGDPNAPVKRNVDEVDKALKMTEKLRTESAPTGAVPMIADTMKCRISM